VGRGGGIKLDYEILCTLLFDCCLCHCLTAYCSVYIICYVTAASHCVIADCCVPYQLDISFCDHFKQVKLILYTAQSTNFFFTIFSPMYMLYFV